MFFLFFIVIVFSKPLVGVLNNYFNFLKPFKLLNILIGLIVLTIFSCIFKVYFKSSLINYIWIISIFYLFEYYLLSLATPSIENTPDTVKLNPNPAVIWRKIYFIIKHSIIILFVLECVITLLFLPLLRQHQGFFIRLIPDQKIYIPEENNYYFYNTDDELVVCKNYIIIVKEVIKVNHLDCSDCQCAMDCQNNYRAYEDRDSIKINVYEEGYKIYSIKLKKGN